MAIHLVTDPRSGISIKVEASVNASKEELIRLANHQYRVQELERISELLRPDPSLLDYAQEIPKGLASGATGIIESSLLGAAAALPEEYETPVREGIMGAFAPALEYLAADRGLEDFVPRKFSEALGSFGGMAAPALIPGAGIAGLVGSAALGVGANVGEASERAREEGASEEERGLAALKAIPVGITEMIPISSLKLLPAAWFKMFGKAKARKVVSTGARIFAQAGAEGAQEFVASVLQNSIEQGYNPEQETFEGGAEAGGYGASVGGFIQAVMEVITKRTRAGRYATLKKERAGIQEERRERDEYDAIEKEKAERIAADQLELEFSKDAADDWATNVAARGPLTLEDIEQAQSDLETDGDVELGGINYILTDGEAVEGYDANGELIGEGANIAEILNSTALEAAVAPKIRETEEVVRKSSEEKLKDAADAKAKADKDAANEFARAKAALAKLEDAADVNEKEAERQERDEYDAIEKEEAERIAAERVEAERVAAELQQEEDLETQQRILSDIETATGTIEQERQNKSAVKRGKILNTVLDENKDTSTFLSQKFSAALKAEGITNTNPTEEELRTIENARNIDRGRVIPAIDLAEQIPEVEGSTDIADLEAAVAPKIREPVQIGLPGLGRNRERKRLGSTEGGVATEEVVRESSEAKMADGSGVEVVDQKKEKAEAERVEAERVEAERVEAERVVEKKEEFTKEERANAKDVGYTLYVLDRVKPGKFSNRTSMRGRDSKTGKKFYAPPKQRALVKEAFDEAAAKGRRIATGQASVREEHKEGLKRTETAAAQVATTAEQEAATKKLAALTNNELVAAVEGVTGDTVADTLVREVKARIADEKRQISNAEIDAFVQAMWATKHAGGVAKKVMDMLRRTKGLLFTNENKNIDLSLDDKAKILTLLNAKRNALLTNKTKKGYRSETSTDASSAQIVFSKLPRLIDNISLLGYHSIFNVSEELNRGNSAEIKEFFKGFKPEQLKQARNWVKENLSTSAQIILKTKIELAKASVGTIEGSALGRQKAETKAKAKAKAKAKQEAEEAEEEAKAKAEEEAKAKAEEEAQEDTAPAEEQEGTAPAEDQDAELEKILVGDKEVGIGETSVEDISDNVQLNLALSEVSALDHPLHPLTTQYVHNGDLKNVLANIAHTSMSGHLRTLAKRLTAILTDTKLEVVNKLINEKDKHVAGLFDPKTNTIQLDAEFGVNTHVLWHEIMHAFTSHNLANKKLKETKQLIALYEAVKDNLGTYYGSQSVDEFVAESVNNIEFRQALGSITLPEGPVRNALEWFSRIIMNGMRRLVGRPPKTKPTVLDRVDALTNAMLSPAPQHRNAGELYAAASKAELYDVWHEGYKNFTKALDKGGWLLTKKIRLATTYRKLSKLAKKGFFATTGVRNTAKFAEDANLKDPTRGEEIIHLMNADIRDGYDSVLASVVKNNKWLRRHSAAQIETLIGVGNKGTLDEVDVTKPASNYKGEKLNRHRELTKELAKVGPDAKDAKIVLKHIIDVYGKIYTDMKDVVFKRIDFIMGDEVEGAKKVKNKVMEMLFKNKLDGYLPLTRKGDYRVTFDFHGELAVKHLHSPALREMFIQEVIRPELKKRYSATEIEQTLKDKENEATTEDEALDILGAVHKSVVSESVVYKDTPSTSFIHDIFKKMDDAAPTVADSKENKTAKTARAMVKADIMEIFIDLLPEASFAKGLQNRKRKGVFGFEENLFEVFEERAHSMRFQVEQLKYAEQLYKVADVKKKELEEALARDDTKNVELIEQMISEAQFAASPPKDQWATIATRLAFLWTIGFNPSSAMVNLTQLALIVYPALATRYGHIEATKMIHKAHKVFVNSGWGTEIKLAADYGDESTIFSRAALNIGNYVVVNKKGQQELRKEVYTKSTLIGKEELRDLGEPVTDILTDYNLLVLIDAAAKRAMLGQSAAFESMDLGEAGKREGWGSKISKWSAFMFHHGEKYTRQITMLSAYMLEVDKRSTVKKTRDGVEYVTKKKLTKAEYEEIALEALQKTEEYNGGTNRNLVASAAREGVLRVALMYKPFGATMYHYLLRTAKTAINQYTAGEKDRGVDKKVLDVLRHEATRQFLGVLGSTLLLSGVQGLPFFAIVAALANLMFLEDDEEDFETIVRLYMGEPLYKGALNLAGEDVAQRVGLSGLLYKTNPFTENLTLGEQLFRLGGGPFVSTGLQFADGLRDAINANNPREVERALETMSPTALRNLMKAVRYIHDDAPLTRKGNVIVDGLDANDIFWQMLGFSPTQYTFQQEKNRSKKKISIAIEQKRSRLLTRMYVAYRFMDYTEVQEIFTEMIEFNNKHMSRVGGELISSATIIKSMKRQHKIASQTKGGVYFSPLMRYASEQADATWGAFDD